MQYAIDEYAMVWAWKHRVGLGCEAAEVRDRVLGCPAAWPKGSRHSVGRHPPHLTRLCTWSSMEEKHGLPELLPLRDTRGCESGGKLSVGHRRGRLTIKRFR